MSRTVGSWPGVGRIVIFFSKKRKTDTHQQSSDVADDVIRTAINDVNAAHSQSITDFSFLVFTSCFFVVV